MKIIVNPAARNNTARISGLSDFIIDSSRFRHGQMPGFAEPPVGFDLPSDAVRRKKEALWKISPE
jgi:hypothetical protein